MTLTVSNDVAEAMKQAAQEDQASTSALAAAAMRDFLIRRAADKEASVDGAWLESAADAFIAENR